MEKNTINNRQKITLDDLKTHYNRENWQYIGYPSNLCNQQVGYYAYLLQKQIRETNPEFVNELLNDKLVLLDNPLELEVCEMKDIWITHKTEDLILEERFKEHPIILSNFKLNFYAWVRGAGYPVEVRNGLLLKSMQDANLNSFEELEFCEAVCVFDNRDVNGTICTFVKFQKK